MNDRSDETVVRACRQGDKAAYALLVKRHYRHVFALCLGALGDAHDAEDTAQDAMLKGFLNIQKLNSNQQFEPWILRIAKNLCIDLLRRQKRCKQHLARQHMRPQKTTDEDPNLQQAIRRLPLELRLPLVMYYFDNKNAKIIAERLNISHSGACQRIRTAREELHKLLTERVHNE